LATIAPLVTVEDLMRLPSDFRELIDGVVIAEFFE